MRYGDAPDPWEAETPPEGCTVVPMASMDVMSFSYSACETLAEIARLQSRGADAARWSLQATRVRDKLVDYLVGRCPRRLL